jgi:hypothetical protein
LPLARRSRLGESGKALEQFFLAGDPGAGVEAAKAQRQRRQIPY